jgi:hypothetical protein
VIVLSSKDEIRLSKVGKKGEDSFKFTMCASTFYFFWSNAFPNEKPPSMEPEG